MTDIRALTFDVGNTLLYCDPPPSEIYASALSNLGRPVTSEDVGPVFSEAWASMQQRTAPGVDRYSSLEGGDRAWWGEFLKQILEQLNHDAPWEHLLDDLYNAFANVEVWKLFPDAISTIEVLRRRGFRLGIISNWDHRLPEILNQLRIDTLFDVISVSAIEGIEKPSPEIFIRTLERLGVDAESTIHVGDALREDYGGAKAVGMHPVLIDRKELFDHQEYRCIEHLVEVVGIVDRWEGRICDTQ